MLEHAEIENNDDCDEELENQQELALREEIGFARLPDEFGDFPHRLVDREIAQFFISEQAEQKAERADSESRHEERPAVDVNERRLAQIRQDQMRFSTSLGRRVLRQTESRRNEEHGKSDEERQKQSDASAAAEMREQSRLSSLMGPLAWNPGPKPSSLYDHPGKRKKPAQNRSETG